jgi:YVTN family beta-propeller protein
MKQFQLKTIFFAMAVASIFSSCRKDNDTNPEEVDITPVRKGLYILNEGSFNSNNGSLTYYDYDTKITVADQFSVANNRGLGDTGNDAQVYGSKLYVVVNVSSTVEVLEAKTAKSIKQIQFKNGDVGRQPRAIVFNKNKAFISSYDGTVAVVDTASLLIEKYITVGRNPERMAIANGKLYVANGGGLDYPNVDHTVSVIDLTSLTETKKIEVTLNPFAVAADQYGDIYVLSYGINDTAPAMNIIDSKTDLVTKKIDNLSAGDIAINGDYAYLTDYSGVQLFNVKTEAIEKTNFITDGTTLTTPYSVTADAVTGEVFITDAKDYSSNGEVFCFDQNGTKKYSLVTGINPGGVAFINK